MNQDVFHQTPYRVRFEWGAEGVRRLAPLSQVVVIIDVLSFTTCVEVAVSRDAVVFPYRYKDDSAIAFAESIDAILAKQRGQTPSLSPYSLLSLPPQARIVLPSQNGSACTVVAQASNVVTIAGCLRNAAAVADYINRHYPNEVVSVIACGEHWEDGGLRPAIEDLLAAGAIISQLDQGNLSPEARVARSAFDQAESEIHTTLQQCSSGCELIEQGFPQDIVVAGELNVSGVVPVYWDGAYRRKAETDEP